MKISPQSYMLTNKTKIILTILCATNFLLFSQEKDKKTEALITDRPDATEASSTVGKGVLQFETGGLYESFEDKNIKSENYTMHP